VTASPLARNKAGCYGLDLTLYDGARYSDNRKRTYAVHQVDPQTLADLLRSLAREVERDAGLRPPSVSAVAEPAQVVEET